MAAASMPLPFPSWEKSAKAAQPTPQASEGAIVLSDDERAAVATALLAQSVMLFNASAAQEAAGRYEQASALFREGYLLSKVELRVRNTRA